MRLSPNLSKRRRRQQPTVSWPVASLGGWRLAVVRGARVQASDRSIVISKAKEQSVIVEAIVIQHDRGNDSDVGHTDIRWSEVTVLRKQINPLANRFGAASHELESESKIIDQDRRRCGVQGGSQGCKPDTATDVGRAAIEIQRGNVAVQVRHAGVAVEVTTPTPRYTVDDPVFAGVSTVAEFEFSTIAVS